MEDLLEGSWLFDDVALGAIDTAAFAVTAADERFMALLPPLLPDMLDDLGVGSPESDALCAGSPPQSTTGAEPPAPDAARALHRSLDDGGVWRCLNRSHPEDCGRCAPHLAPRPGGARCEQRYRAW